MGNREKKWKARGREKIKGIIKKARNRLKKRKRDKGKRRERKMDNGSKTEQVCDKTLILFYVSIGANLTDTLFLSNCHVRLNNILM